MIVICTTCQAKFRVADEKIGPRGAKVRCSRCQSVFLVQPDGGMGSPHVPAAVAPVARHVDLEPRAPDFTVGAPPSADNPFAANPVRAWTPPPIPEAPPVPAPAPIAALQAPLEDPFMAAALGTAAGAGSSPADDPFAVSASERDPFEAPPPRTVSAAPPPIPSSALPPPIPSSAAPQPSEDFGLALEDRLTPPPMSMTARGGGGSPTQDSFSSIDVAPFTPGGAGEALGGLESGPFDAGSFALAGPEDESLALSTDPPARSAPAPAMAAPAPSAPPPAAPATAAAADAHPVDGRIPGRRASRLRAVAVNAVALAVLLVAALAILVVWRTEGPVEVGALRPAAILGALRSGGAAAGPFVAADIRSGVYERERGTPLLFVRGRIVSRAPAAVRAVRVSVEIVRGTQVLTRGAALAGAVPTAEELYRAADPAALEALAKAIAPRAPREIRPGDDVPFLVTIGDHPADLGGASLRVEVSAGATP